MNESLDSLSCDILRTDEVESATHIPGAQVACGTELTSNAKVHQDTTASVNDDVQLHSNETAVKEVVSPGPCNLRPDSCSLNTRNEVIPSISNPVPTIQLNFEQTDRSPVHSSSNEKVNTNQNEKSGVPSNMNEVGMHQKNSTTNDQKHKTKLKTVLKAEETEQLTLAKSLINNLEMKVNDLENTNTFLNSELNLHSVDQMKSTHTFEQQVHTENIGTNWQRNQNVETELSHLRENIHSLELESIRQRLSAMETNITQNRSHLQQYPYSLYPPPPQGLPMYPGTYHTHIPSQPQYNPYINLRPPLHTGLYPHNMNNYNLYGNVMSPPTSGFQTHMQASQHSRADVGRFRGPPMYMRPMHRPAAPQPPEAAQARKEAPIHAPRHPTHPSTQVNASTHRRQSVTRSSETGETPATITTEQLPIIIADDDVAENAANSQPTVHEPTQQNDTESNSTNLNYEKQSTSKATDPVNNELPIQQPETDKQPFVCSGRASHLTWRM